jgi:hypothetical protein
MKINKHGAFIMTENAVRVEGWLVEREVTDPADATTEQLLLEVAIPWAQKKLNETIANELRKVAKLRRDAAQRLVENQNEISRAS